MWEEAESDIYLWTRYLGKEMRDVTAIFAVSRLKIKRGLVPVGFSLIFSTPIFSTQGCCSALVCLWYRWTWSQCVSVGLWTTHCVLMGQLPVWHFQKAVGDPESLKGPRITETVVTLAFTTCFTHSGAHMIFSSWKKGPVPARSDAEHFLPQCVTHSHPAWLWKPCSQLASSKAVNFFTKMGGWKNTEPAGQPSGACSRITSNSSFFFGCLSPLGQGLGRRAKGTLVGAKLYLVPYLEKLLIISPHPKGQKKHCRLLNTLFIYKEADLFCTRLSSKMYSGKVQIHSLVLQREN